MRLRQVPFVACLLTLFACVTYGNPNVPLGRGPAMDADLVPKGSGWYCYTYDFGKTRGNCLRTQADCEQDRQRGQQWANQSGAQISAQYGRPFEGVTASACELKARAYCSTTSFTVTKLCDPSHSCTPEEAAGQPMKAWTTDCFPIREMCDMQRCDKPNLASKCSVCGEVP